MGVVAMLIIVACAGTLFQKQSFIQTALESAATLSEKQIPIHCQQDASHELAPLAGKYCAGLFAFGLFNASLFAASVLPLSTAYYVCEGFGWETGIDKRFREAPQFFGLYSLLIVLGGAFILIPRFPLLGVMYLSQVLNGVLLPFILIFMLLLVNRTDLMGVHVNSRTFNVIAWGTSGIMIVLTLVMVG